MSRIRILTDALASQVAAGEVVERPAAVIRELVENSLDAQATHVEVHVQRGGAALLKVVDNGHGMDREDALLCLERHATSKIRTKEDLSAIVTFGFRGEAVPSIASVARFRLATRPPDALSGTEVEVHGGRLIAVKDYGGAPGTVVEARSLFYNVPARRKFLRSEQTEFSHVEQQFRLHAIANPHVAFSLLRDGVLVFHLPVGQTLRARIEGLYGQDLAARLIDIPTPATDGIRLRGFVGQAGVSRPNKQMQLVFLNGRPVDSPTITYALREGYHTALMKGQFPITFLFLEMPPESFDINVHPAKKEVRFYDATLVKEAVVTAVVAALGSNTRITQGHVPFPSASTLSPAPSESLPVQAALIPDSPQTALRRDWNSLSTWQTNTAVQGDRSTTLDSSQPAHLEAGATESISSSSNAVSHIAPQQPYAAEGVSSAPQTPNTQTQPPATPDASQFRILGVLHKLYVLMEGAEGLVLMDQHAAHERVLFEQMLHAMEQEGVPSQRLLLPLTWQLGPRDYDIIRQHLPVLQKLGIEAEPFGPNALKIDALPTFLKTDDPLALLGDVLDELSSASNRTSALRLGEDMIATTVCRHAVKANDYLREPELAKLLRDLLACEMPYCCPHGRPTLIQISLGELERKFGRRAP